MFEVNEVNNNNYYDSGAGKSDRYSNSHKGPSYNIGEVLGNNAKNKSYSRMNVYYNENDQPCIKVIDKNGNVIKDKDTAIKLLGLKRHEKTFMEGIKQFFNGKEAPEYYTKSDLYYGAPGNSSNNSIHFIWNEKSKAFDIGHVNGDGTFYRFNTLQKSMLSTHEIISLGAALYTKI